MKVSFVIPIYNHFPLINQLLIDIRDNCTPDEIIVVDDCSNDKDTLDGISWWENNFNVKLLRPLENLGFLKASNYGISKATGDIVCLISSDVRIEEDLAKVVRETLALNPEALIGGVLYTQDTGWNTFDGKVFGYLEGWLLCCTKSAWKDLGGFDERFCPSDMEDVDISTTAREKGYALIPLNSPKIRHLGGGTIKYGEEREKITRANKKKFEEKWVTSQRNLP